MTLFTSGSPSMSICALGPESRARLIDNRISGMPREKLPAVTQICFRLWPCGPRAFDGYDYTAMIKTNPAQPKLSGDRIAELIQGISYAWEINNITADILSPDWTRVKGIVFDSSDSNKDSDLTSDNGGTRLRRIISPTLTSMTKLAST